MAEHALNIHFICFEFLRCNTIYVCLGSNTARQRSNERKKSGLKFILTISTND